MSIIFSVKIERKDKNAPRLNDEMVKVPGIYKNPRIGTPSPQTFREQENFPFDTALSIPNSIHLLPSPFQ